MTKVNFELDIEGLRDLMKSPEMQSILQETAAHVAHNASMLSAGAEFGNAVHTANYVSIGTAFPESSEAAKASYQNNVLEKALSGLPRTK